MLLSRVARVALVSCAIAASACNTYRDELARGQRAFEQNDHDRALTILRELEIDLGRLSPSERAQYAYVRGMSDYRIGYRLDARHWLALAKAYDEQTPGALSADWKARTGDTLTELNKVVYSDGIQALTNSQAPDEQAAKDEEAPPPPARAPKKASPAASPPSE
jgi:hypothetical protein